MLTRKKKATKKRRNPCLPCNPGLGRTRMKRNPEDERQLRYEIREMINHICANLRYMEDAEFNSIDKMISFRDKLNKIYKMI